MQETAEKEIKKGNFHVIKENAQSEKMELNLEDQSISSAKQYKNTTKNHTAAKFSMFKKEENV